MMRRCPHTAVSSGLSRAIHACRHGRSSPLARSPAISCFPDRHHSGFIPVLGQLDDLAFFSWARFFIRNAPKEVVEDHMGRIARNDDELKPDLERAQGVLSNRATDLRATLDRILSRDREGDNS